jgi:hypothetical protein
MAGLTTSKDRGSVGAPLSSSSVLETTVAATSAAARVDTVEKEGSGFGVIVDINTVNVFKWDELWLFRACVQPETLLMEEAQRWSALKRGC